MNFSFVRLQLQEFTFVTQQKLSKLEISYSVTTLAQKTIVLEDTLWKGHFKITLPLEREGKNNKYAGSWGDTNTNHGS